MVIAQQVTKESGFVGLECALCNEPFAPGEELVACPLEGALHHAYCWQANGNHCTSLGCRGHGVVGEEAVAFEDEVDFEEDDSAEFIEPVNDEPSPSTAQATDENSNAPQQDVRQPWHFGLAQSCLMLAIAIAIIVMAFSCFGLWAILDYVMIELAGLDYRPTP